MESLPSEQRKRILVVEDDLELREQILVPDLTEMGFDVQGAGSALEMYRYLIRSEVDAVVLDVGLPDEDGFSALTHLRRSADIAVVLLTGRSGSADQIRGLDGGADAYLVKPVETEVLQRRCEAFCAAVARPRPSKLSLRFSMPMAGISPWMAGDSPHPSASRCSFPTRSFCSSPR